MKLLKLQLSNFKGIKFFEFEPNGYSTNIYGANYVGKTSVFDAMTWLLFNKPSGEDKDFTPKTNDDKGGYLHNLHHIVEGVFQLASGQIVTLRKNYHEVYKDKRGTAQKEFAGHTTDHYIDGVKVNEKEYQALIIDVCGDFEKAKILTKPHYFSTELHWEKRRQLLLDMCGNISDETVMNSNPELKKLPDLLMKPGMNEMYAVEDYRKIASARKMEINKELQVIPNRIDEATKAMPEVILNGEELDKQIDQLTREKAEIEMQKASASVDSVQQDFRKQITEIEMKTAKAATEYIDQLNQENAVSRIAIDMLLGEKTTILLAENNNKNEINNLQNQLDGMEKLRKNLLKDFNAVNEVRWDESEEVCPTCHRRLDANDIEQMKSDFNKRRSEKLENINKRGQQEASKDMIAATQVKIGHLTRGIEELGKQVIDLDKRIVEHNKQLKPQNTFYQTEIFTALDQEKNRLNQLLIDASGAVKEKTVEFDTKIATIQAKINKQLMLKADAVVAKKQKERISELTAREKELSSQYEKVEYGLYLCEQFIKTKVAMLDERINSHFDNVRFKLFVEQINGGVKEDCIVLVPSPKGALVPYNPANTAGKLNAGLEIINVLSKHFGICLPVFVDNAEGVTEIDPLDLQLIKLNVSATDKVLRIETQNEQFTETLF